MVHWGGEMGRLPVIQNDAGVASVGRDHNTYGFSSWMAGGGIKGGCVHGATDDFGHHAVKDVVTHTTSTRRSSTCSGSIPARSRSVARTARARWSTASHRGLSGRYSPDPDWRPKWTGSVSGRAGSARVRAGRGRE